MESSGHSDRFDDSTAMAALSPHTGMREVSTEGRCMPLAFLPRRSPVHGFKVKSTK